jgi:predicted amino acid dehydrogenase
MSLKIADNALHVIEGVIVVASLAGWAALGFPAWKTVAIIGLVGMIGIGVFQWLASRQI